MLCFGALAVDVLSTNLKVLGSLTKKMRENDDKSGVSGLEATARKIEKTIAGNSDGVIDEAVINAFKSSKGADSRYEISTAEPPMIRNAKAMINLLRSLDGLPPQLIDGMIKNGTALKNAFLNSETDFQVSSIAKTLALNGANVAADIYLDPAKHIARFLTSDLGHAAAEVVANVANNPGKYANKVANFLWENAGAIVNPKQAISNAATNFIEDKTAPFKPIIRDLEVYLHEAKQLKTAVQELTDTANPAINKLKQLSGALADNDISQMYEQFNKGLRNSAEGITGEASTNHLGIKAKTSGTTLGAKTSSPLATGLTSSQRAQLAVLDEMSSLVNKRLAEKNLSTLEQDQLKKVLKIGSEMNFIATNAMRIQNEGVALKDLKDLNKYVKKIGTIWKDLKGLQGNKLSATFLEKGINQIYDSLTTPLKEVVVLTLDAEIKLGLSKDILLPKLEKISKEMNAFADKTGLKKVTGSPFAEERKIALARNMLEHQGKQKIMEDAAKYIRDNPINGTKPTLMQTLKLIEQLEKIPTLSSANYINKLQAYRDEITGLKKMNSEIGALESEIFVLNEKIKNTDLSQLDAQEIIFHEDTKKKLASKFQEVDSAYKARDRVKSALKKVETWKNDFSHRNNSYFQADDYVHIQEKVNSKQIDEVNALADKVIKDIHSAANDSSNELERLNKQMRSLGGDADEYMEKERVKIATTEKAADEQAPQRSAKVSSSLTDREMDRIEKKVSNRNEAKYRESLNQQISAGDQLGEAQVLESRHKAIIADIRSRAGEEITTQIKDARKSFINSVKAVLTDEQSALLSKDKKNGTRIYPPSAADTVLLRNIKNISNVMTRFENLTELAVKFRAISAGGYANLELVALAAPLRTELNSLLSELETTRKDMRTLGSVLGHSLNQVADGFDAILPIVDHIPKMLSQMATNFGGLSEFVDFDQLKKVAALPELELQKVFAKLRPMNEGSPSAPGLDVKYVLKSFAKKLYQNTSQLAYGKLLDAGIKPEKNGQYKLSRINPESAEYGLAVLHNGAAKLMEVLDAATEISAGSKVTGNAKLVASAVSIVKEVMENYEKITKVTLPKYSDSADQLSVQMRAEFEKMKKEVAKVLETVQPAINHFTTTAEIAEESLGLKKGVLTKPLTSKVQVLEEATGLVGVLSPAATREKKQAARKGKLVAAQSQLEMLQNLKTNPKNNASLVDAQIQHSQKIIKKLETKIQTADRLGQAGKGAVPAKLGLSAKNGPSDAPVLPVKNEAQTNRKTTLGQIGTRSRTLISKQTSSSPPEKPASPKQPSSAPKTVAPVAHQAESPAARVSQTRPTPKQPSLAHKTVAPVALKQESPGARVSLTKPTLKRLSTGPKTVTRVGQQPASQTRRNSQTVVRKSIRVR